ncbi:hypothetical protein [uncultured Corynebacterium sp.]|uniref:hypothetical protein n=1 Tax=uncultured Corynebacterium sp. TaxID=159447 RepID=UPI0025E34266|nr:hypothetical protein [uncultured Corynebacterium sp.]
MVEAFVIVSVALSAADWLTERFKLVGPLVQFGVGLVLSLIPHLPNLTVPAD